MCFGRRRLDWECGRCSHVEISAARPLVHFFQRQQVLRVAQIPELACQEHTDREVFFDVLFQLDLL